MPKIGDAIAETTCKHCSVPIKLEYWGAGGNDWTHVDTDRWECRKSPNATPPDGFEVPASTDRKA
jgi:hypothetical protein